MPRLLASLTALLAALVLAGCGGSGASEGAAGARDAGAVIRGWAADVREGRFAEANARFALPAVIANGGPEITVDSTAEVDAFNRGLTCGAVVTDTRAIDGGRVLATFRLTEREGAASACGTGVGQRAQVTFRIEDGRIVEWRRAGDPPPGSVEV